MKNIIVIGISQSGLYDYVSQLDVNQGRQKGYEVLGGFFNSFGDQYRTELRSTERTAISTAEYSEGSHKRTFGLNREGLIKAYRDYGNPAMSPVNEVKELERRLSLLKKAKGHYIMALTTWDLQNMSQKAPQLVSEVLELLENSDVVILHPGNVEDAVASYLLANETGGWVVPKTQLPVRLNRQFNVKGVHLEAFEKQFKILKSIAKRLPSAKNLSVEEALASAGPAPATFGRPNYSQKAISYFNDAQEIKKFVSKLS